MVTPTTMMEHVKAAVMQELGGLRMGREAEEMSSDIAHRYLCSRGIFGVKIVFTCDYAKNSLDVTDVMWGNF